MLTLLISILCFALAFAGDYYSDSSAQFHPSGRILVTEQARQVVNEKGGPVCAVKCSDGIILSASRRIRSNSLVVKPHQKIFHVDRHITIGATGYLSQSKQVIEAVKSLCSEYRRKYSSPIPVEALCDELAQVYHRMTLEGQHQPIGVALVVCGWDEDVGPQILTVDPEGSSKGWNAVAIGADSNVLMDQLATIMPKDIENTLNSVRKSKTLSSMERMWPKFKSHLLQKYFSNKDVNAGMLVASKGFDEFEWSNGAAREDAQWVTEVFTCLQASSGEICWTQNVV